MVHYRSLRPETERQKSPRKAAREGVRPEIERLTGEGVAALPAGLGPRPSKVAQLERMIKAGRVGDPLKGIEVEMAKCPHPNPPPHSPPDGGRSPAYAGEGIEVSSAADDPHPAAQERGHPPPCRGREEAAAGEGVQAPCATSGISLLERVRQLYEESVVPVREIARLIGVSERTLYKYVARHGWRRRHLCLERATAPGDYAAVRAANRGRTLTPRAPFAPELLHSRGAGGRFIAYEERARPQATSFAFGPKALDPLAAEALAPVCAEAALASEQEIAEAVARAAAEEEQKRCARAFDAKMATMGRLQRTLRQICADMEKSSPEDKPQHRKLADLVMGQMAALYPLREEACSPDAVQRVMK